MPTRVTATQLLSHLRCPHRPAMDATEDPALRDPANPFLQLLWERGISFEKSVMQASGREYLDLSALHGEQKESATREAIARREPLIYGGRLSVRELLGEPDLLRWEQGGYVAIDIKSGAAAEGEDGEGGGRLKAHYGVQLALYTDILEQMGLAAGRFGYILDVTGTEVRFDLDQPRGPRSPCLWEIYLKTRQALRETLAHPAGSRPALSSACKLCHWRTTCLGVLERTDDLTLLPELGRAAREALGEEFPTRAALAQADVEQFIDGEHTPFVRIGAGRLRRFQRRAMLARGESPAPHLVQSIELPHAPVQLFFDIETDPMRGRCYLHGFVIRQRDTAGDVQERFEGAFSATDDAAGERAAFASAMALMRAHPAGLVVHYGPYERTEYHRLAQRYPEVARVSEIEALFAPGRALDLYTGVIRPFTDWPTRDYSIKSIAKWCGFGWRDTDPSGASSIEWYDRWARTGDPSLRQRLLDYNEDDCRAMRVVWDHLAGLPVA